MASPCLSLAETHHHYIVFVTQVKCSGCAWLLLLPTAAVCPARSMALCCRVVAMQQGAEGTERFCIKQLLKPVDNVSLQPAHTECWCLFAFRLYRVLWYRVNKDFSSSVPMTACMIHSQDFMRRQLSYFTILLDYKLQLHMLQALNASFERYQEERRGQGFREHETLMAA